MVQKTAPNLGMNYGWDLGESGWKPGMDANMKKLDAIVGAAVLAIANSPSVTDDGTRYIVGTSPSGAFAGQAGKLAVRVEGAWEFYTPRAGWSVYNLANGTAYRYTGSAWVIPAIAIPAQPFLEVSGPGTETFDNTAWVKVPLKVIASDTADGWDATANTDYVIPQAGMYQIQGIVRPARTGSNPFPDSTAFAAGIGTTAADGDDVAWAVSPDVAGAQFTLQVAALRRYNAGDRVSLFVKHSATSPIAISRARLRVLRLTD